MALPPPPDTLPDNNLLVATGMAICRSITKSVSVVISSRPVGHCFIASGIPVILIILLLMMHLSLVIKLDALILCPAQTW